MTFQITEIGGGALFGGSIVNIIVPAGGVPKGAMIVLLASDASATGAFGSVADAKSNTYNAVSDKVFLNGDSANGFGRCFYATNVLALVAGDAITYTISLSGNDATVSVFYVIGENLAADPLDTAVTTSATGSSSTPSVTSAAPSGTGRLFFGVVHWTAATTTFTQDSTNAAYTTPPTKQAVNSGAHHECVAGGRFLNAGSGALTYAPTIGASGPWTAFIFAFQLAPEILIKRYPLWSRSRKPRARMFERFWWPRRWRRLAPNPAQPAGFAPMRRPRFPRAKIKRTFVRFWWLRRWKRLGFPAAPAGFAPVHFPRFPRAKIKRFFSALQRLRAKQHLPSLELHPRTPDWTASSNPQRFRIDYLLNKLRQTPPRLKD